MASVHVLSVELQCLLDPLEGKSVPRVLPEGVSVELEERLLLEVPERCSGRQQVVPREQQ